MSRVFVAALLVAAGCGGADTPEDDVFTVTQADDGCSVSGPTEVPAGQAHYFIVKNPSQAHADLYVSKLQDGKTLQDLIEPQTHPGEYYPKPWWVVYAKSEPLLASKFSPSTELAADERVEAFFLDQGLHAIYTHIRGSLWFCSTFQAT